MHYFVDVGVHWNNWTWATNLDASQMDATNCAIGCMRIAQNLVSFNLRKAWVQPSRRNRCVYGRRSDRHWNRSATKCTDHPRPKTPNRQRCGFIISIDIDGWLSFVGGWIEQAKRTHFCMCIFMSMWICIQVLQGPKTNKGQHNDLQHDPHRR